MQDVDFTGQPQRQGPPDHTWHKQTFLADRNNGRAYGTMLCPSVCRL